ncbi:MAG TPA: glycosyltransferase family 4 protein [Thermoanaerobaculia bacterium]|nr:glycosyltransferase family 4 protein [Thermoanaerobaculia bacterium]
MRVLLVTNTYPPGDVSGVGTLASELAHRLGLGGHFVTVLTRRPPPHDPHGQAVRGPKLLFPLLAALRFARSPRTPWDLVQVHESDGALVAVVLRLLRAFSMRAGQARLVATLQVSYVEERRAVRPILADGEVVSRPTPGERVFAWLRAPLLAALGRLTARLADAVVAPSHATAAELRRDYGVADVEVIANGVPPGRQPPPHRREVPPVILYSGRLRTRKAVAVLLAAMPRVLAAFPACRLVIVGDGEQGKRIAAAVRARGLTAHVDLAGVLPRAGAVARLAEADVFCLPSTYEGLPLAILEAMAAGLPVVATAVSGNPEAVEDGVTGLLVPPESASALAEALIALLADPERRRRMGEAGRARVAERFGIDRIAAEHLALLRRLATG